MARTAAVLRAAACALALATAWAHPASLTRRSTTAHATTDASGARAAASTDSAVRIALYLGGGAGYQPKYHATLATAATMAFGEGGFTLQNLTADAVANLDRANLDVVVFPGGSGNSQAAAVGVQGLAAIRKFVTAGGAYIGTCGGSYLGLQHVGFYLPRNHPPCGDPNATHCTPATQEPWDRGDGDVLVEFTPQGLSQLNLSSQRFGGNVTIFYGQGPIIKAADLPPTVSQLAFYRSEIHSKNTNETKGEMVNTPAITSLDGYSDVQGEQGGRVVLNSPHPELTEPPIPEIYAGELEWVTKLR